MADSARGRLCHPILIANEQTQEFSLKFIIVTMNEFKVSLVAALSALSSHQPVDHLGPTNEALCTSTRRGTKTHPNTRQTPKTENQIS